MFTRFRSIILFGAFSFAVTFSGIDETKGQMPIPVYTTSSPVVVVKRPFFHHHRSFVATVPVQYTYSAYYAPQVPVVPVVPAPVSTVSAYYVPTAPVVSEVYYAPVIPARRVRRYAVPVAPVVVHPVYWSRY